MEEFLDQLEQLNKDFPDLYKEGPYPIIFHRVQKIARSEYQMGLRSALLWGMGFLKWYQKYVEYWDGKDKNGMYVSNGVYYVQITIDDKVFNSKITFIK